MSKEIKMPKKGDKMYVHSSYSISNGSSDVAGGLATIQKVEVSKTLPADHPNAIFVSFKEIPNRGYNYKYLLEEQKRLKKEYKGKVAHPDPDIDTPWIEPGDIVDGKVYKGKPIW